MKSLHGNADQITRGLIRYLEKNHQLDLLPELVRRQARAAKAKSDPNLAKITTAVTLTKGQLQELTSTLTHVFHRPVTVTNTVNSDLIGGMIIRLGDQVLDLSLQTKLNTLHQQLTS